MGRPRKNVFATLDNSSHVKAYFDEALVDNHRVGKLLIDSSLAYEARRALSDIPDVCFCDINEHKSLLNKSFTTLKSSDRAFERVGKGRSVPDTDDLNAWLKQYVTEEGWRQCDNNLRQKKYATGKGTQLTPIRIRRFTASRLRMLAEKTAKARGREVSIDDVLNDLLDSIKVSI